jgi:hypothetical protein
MVRELPQASIKERSVPRIDSMPHGNHSVHEVHLNLPNLPALPQL